MGLVLQTCDDVVKVQISFASDLLSCHALNPARYPFLLESHHPKNSTNGVDILFAYPGETLEISRVGDTEFFTQLDERVSRGSAFTENKRINTLPFTGGWFVFLSYEVIGSIEHKLSSLVADESLPIASAVRIPVAVIKDHADKTCWIVCESGFEDQLHEVWADIQDSTQPPLKPAKVTLKEDAPECFLEGVDKIKNYLVEGDTLQVNLSRQWSGKLLDGSNYLDVYRSLRRQNPSPFSGLACYGNSVICSSSPERLVSCLDNKVQMRPIAGTRPRHEDAGMDKTLAEDLLANSKENAEHIMLIDLIRNDLGRICETGTIAVDEKMVLESYAAVHHIVSNVSGQLKAGTSVSDIIKAVFPGGTITGCPKVRCMEIIQELEQKPRGAYTGSMGYINNNGDLDFNILIRTFTVNGEQISLRTGAGIVTDSIADNELKETRHKAKALLSALTLE